MANRVYISASVKDELRFKQIRNLIWARTNAQEYYKKKTPHLTIVPAFGVQHENLDDVKSIVDDASFKGKDVTVDTVSVYENIHKPYVVQLNVSHDFHNEIDNLISQLEEYSHGNIRYPASPHITLFKTKGYWDTVPEDMKLRLQNEIMVTQLPNTELSGTEIDIK